MKPSEIFGKLCVLGIPKQFSPVQKVLPKENNSISHWIDEKMEKILSQQLVSELSQGQGQQNSTFSSENPSTSAEHNETRLNDVAKRELKFRSL